MKKIVSTFALAAAVTMGSAVVMASDAQAASVKLTFDGWEPTSNQTSKFKHGTKVADQYNTAEYGFVTIEGSSNRRGADDSINYAGIYSSKKKNGADTDLEPRSSNGKKYLGFENTADSSDQFLDDRQDRLKVGNVLIVQEATELATNKHGRYSRPDDEGHGGVISMMFGDPVQLLGFDYFDIDHSTQNERLKVSYFDVATDLWTALLLDDNGGTGGDDTGRRYVSPDNPIISGLLFEFKSSGAIDNIRYALNNTSTGPVSAVPIPGAAPLFLTGLAGMAYMSRRKKKAQEAA